MKLKTGMIVESIWDDGPYTIIEIEEYDYNEPHDNVHVKDKSDRNFWFDQNDLQEIYD